VIIDHRLIDERAIVLAAVDDQALAGGVVSMLNDFGQLPLLDQRGSA